MYQMAAVTQYSVTVAGDGTAMLIFQPYSALLPLPATNGPFLAFATAGSGTGLVDPAPKFAGPFSGQFTNTLAYALDTFSL